MGAGFGCVTLQGGRPIAADQSCTIDFVRLYAGSWKHAAIQYAFILPQPPRNATNAWLFQQKGKFDELRDGMRRFKPQAAIGNLRITTRYQGMLPLWRIDFFSLMFGR